MDCRFVRRISSSRPWDKKGARFKKKKFFRPFGPQFGLGGLKIFSYPSGLASPLCLKELCHEIYQNSNQGNCHRTEWNIKITAQKVRRKYKWSLNDTANTKGSTDGQILGRLKRIAILVFENFIFVVCANWYNAWKTNFVRQRAVICHSPVISQVS